MDPGTIQEKEHARSVGETCPKVRAVIYCRGCLGAQFEPRSKPAGQIDIRSARTRCGHGERLKVFTCPIIGEATAGFVNLHQVVLPWFARVHVGVGQN